MKSPVAVRGQSRAWSVLGVGVLGAAGLLGACRDDPKPPSTVVLTDGGADAGGPSLDGGLAGDAAIGADASSDSAGDAAIADGAATDASLDDSAGAETGVDASAPPPVDAAVDAATPPVDAAVTPDAPSPGTPARPFYSHPAPYPAGVISPTGVAQPMLDGAVGAFYNAWKKYLVKGCGGYYVDAGDTFGANVATKSQLQGYGMIVEVIMAGHEPDARAIFEGLFAFARSFKGARNPALMAGQVNNGGGSCKVAAGGDAETDGDLDIAFALLMADKQWGSASGAVNYLDEAKKTIAAIKATEFNPATHLPLVADYVTSDSDQYLHVRSSDLMAGHFRAFQAATGDTFWADAVTATYALLPKLQAPVTGLVPEYADKVDGTPLPLGGVNGIYGYEAARLPLRLTTDFLASQEAGAKAGVAKMTSWIRMHTGDNPALIVDGYRLDGANSGGPGQGPSFAFEGPFGAAAVVDATNQAWLDAIWKRASAGNPNDDSYADTIRLLSLIVMSRNWWAP